MIHPDMQDATVELVGALTPNVYTRLPADLQSSLPAVLVIASQDDSQLFAEHTASFEVYHEDVEQARRLSRLIVAHLTSGQHATDAGLIDEYWVDVQPREVPYVEDIAQFTFTMKAATRPV